MAEPHAVAPPADAPAENNAAADGVTRQIKMDIYAPPVFHGRSTDDALSFLQYVERYAAFKQMNDTEKLQFITILLRDTASDFYEALPNTDRESWDRFKPAFLSRFGRSEAVRWRDTSDLYTMSQLIDESAEDFIARVMKKAKYVPNIDESLLRSAVIQGLRPQIRSHVLQANIHNMADLLQAARVADVATTSSDPTFQQLLTEIRVSNEQHAKHNAAFELLSSRLNNLHVSSADTNNTSRSRSSSPRRVRFDTPERPPPSPGYNYRRSDKDRPPRRYYDNANRNNCNYCGMIHRGNRCPAADAQCLYCGRVGHFRAVCRQALRSQNQRGRISRPRI